MMGLQDMLVSLRAGTAGTSAGRMVAFVGVLIVLFLLAIVVIEAVRSRTPRGRVEALLDERGRTSDSMRWVVRISALLLVFVGIYLMEVRFDDPAQCATCHTEADYSATLAESQHSSLSCMACHGARGVVAPVADAATWGRWTMVYASRKAAPEPQAGSVSSADCLRCHEAVVEGIAERAGIRVRHSDFLAAGANCMECHSAVAHGDVIATPTEPGMNKCLLCHDGTMASAECEYCHVDEPETSNIQLASLPKIKQLDTGNCYACHDEKPCLRCHGSTMPHPKGWAPNDGGPLNSGSHPREGFADREVCWRCHFAEGKPFVAADEACPCHGLLGRMHGGEPWVREHALQATGKKPGAEAECFACHTSELCAMCHPANYVDLYNPIVGQSDYPRDIPHDPDYWEY